MSIFAPDGKLARCLNCIGNLMILNILTLICCIPLVTAGAAMTALYTMTMRMARNEEGSIVREYFQAFKENFKQATILWMIFGSLMVFLAFDIYILRSITGTFGLVYRILLFVILLGVFAIGAPGVPGGTVMASLGLITGILGFDENGTALMLAIFALQDSFGTACNVTGDGALTLILTSYADRKHIKEGSME